MLMDMLAEVLSPSFYQLVAVDMADQHLTGFLISCIYLHFNIAYNFFCCVKLILLSPEFISWNCVLKTVMVSSKDLLNWLINGWRRAVMVLKVRLKYVTFWEVIFMAKMISNLLILLLLMNIKRGYGTFSYILVDWDAGYESVTKNTGEKCNLTQNIYMTSVEST